MRRWSKWLVGGSDRRCTFYDLRKIRPERRRPRSPIIQFYSSANNIGNYLPVLGIKKMLPFTTDVWCVHDKAIDFDFVNRHYRCGIVGGAGLLHFGFEPFWRALLRECRIPIMIWGIGCCMPDRVRSDPAQLGVPRSVVAAVATRCDLVNVRDDVTAEYYGLDHVSIAPCPTVAYLDDVRNSRAPTRYDYLIALHKSLMSPEEVRSTFDVVKAMRVRAVYTENRQTFHLGLSDVINALYRRSGAVITSRLHGAIVAYALEVPYVAIAYDEKLRAFCRLYGNGLCGSSAHDIAPLSAELKALPIRPPLIEPVYEFGRLASQWAAKHVVGSESAVPQPSP